MLKLSLGSVKYAQKCLFLVNVQTYPHLNVIKKYVKNWLLDLKKYKRAHYGKYGGDQLTLW